MYATNIVLVLSHPPVLKMKRCPVKLSIKVADSDKKQMVQKLHGYHAKARACTSPAAAMAGEGAGGMNNRCNAYCRRTCRFAGRGVV